MGTILITGAARGIGAALHKQASQDGHRVIGTTRAEPNEPDWHRLDVADPGAFAALANALHGVHLDLLVCNAGVYLDKGMALEDYTGTELQETFAVNVTGVFLTIQALLPCMATAARIAIVSSVMGSNERASGTAYAYRASKAAVTNLASNLALDLAPRGIAVGAYHPGWVQTDMGGPTASITVAESAKGLLARFEQLAPSTSGVFETYDGQPIPF
ncbi:MAG: SDR family oxidoreductase [Pseudomonadota bacterium]